MKVQNKLHLHGPRMLAIIHGLQVDWLKENNGRMVTIVKAHPARPGWWVVVPRPADPELHIVSHEGQPTRGEAAAVRTINLMVVGPVD